MSPRIWMTIAALLGAGGVMLGAYQAHGLEKSLVKRGLSEVEVVKQLHNCEVGVRYQMFHALAILAVALLFWRQPHMVLHMTGVFFLLGVAMFSGGLYLGVFTGDMIHWAIVPVGGLLLILGWLGLLITAWLPAAAPLSS
ncbi:DUF423 domain-containing protein [Lignipirellula cremea]|uniref:DUF423 domain-containing protein n=1 Tax=Lignipirellula cremea TaxID=2528010 RepID=A0A518DV14_9BACT|nr:DUF423 domain-containing protein [Lignipirellula cremea]QDU95681.1 hypothetical protein Pla8534_34980 [Lignipirellula cremea]